MKLIVGLGNPGRKYEATRHNAGFWWVERLAAHARVTLAATARFHGRTARVQAPHDLWLLLPDTFMNHSGQAVAALAGFYKIAADDILVVHDELDLPPGTARIKKGGGTAGHNGLSDIAEQIGARDFWRLRLGIGHPRDAQREQEVVDYVLHPPLRDEQTAIDDAMTRSLALWPQIAEHHMEAAMLKLHTKA